jgi:glycosyltransferase 2 family protein
VAKLLSPNGRRAQGISAEISQHELALTRGNLETRPGMGDLSWTEARLRPKQPAWRRLAPWAVGVFALFTVIILAAFHFATLEQFAKLASAARPDWFLAACVAQAATYPCAALAWRQALSRAGYPQPFWRLVPLGLAKQFMDQVVPSSGISGAALVAGGLTRRGIPGHIVMAVLLVSLVSYFAAYLLAVLASVAMLWLHDRADAPVLAAATLFAIAVFVIPAAVLWIKARAYRVSGNSLTWIPGAGRLRDALAKAPTGLLRDPVLLAQTVGLEIAGFALDAVTLWLVLQALGVPVPLWVALVSFMIASMTATLGPIPLGLGTFEAGCVGMLVLLGVAVEAALAGTLLLRGLTFWVPMIPGLWIARREIAI